MALSHGSPKKIRKIKSQWDIKDPKDFEEMQQAIEDMKEENDKDDTIRGQVRITAGRAKNTLINIPPRTRPVTDRMKVRLFDILREDIANTKVLDLYSGSGSFGLEAISRGAKEATLVDASKRAAELLEENVARAGFLTECSVIKEKSMNFLKQAKNNEDFYEVVFTDPPYKIFKKKARYKVKELLTAIRDILPGYQEINTEKFPGVIIMKHPTKYEADNFEIQGLKHFEQIQVGKNSMSMYIVDIPYLKSLSS